MELKTCSKCFITMDISNYGLNKSNSDGYKSYCKSCNSIYMKEYRKLRGLEYARKERENSKMYYHNIKNHGDEYYLNQLEAVKRQLTLRNIEIPNN